MADLAAARSLKVLAEFTEVESGGRNDRPKLLEALHHARVTGATLLIAKLDRLSRNAAFLLTLRDSGVRFMATDIPDANDVTIGVLAVIAQAEREATSARTKAALATVKAKVGSGQGYISRRSGRPVERLGNPNGADAFRRAARGSTAALRAVQERANRHALDLAPVVARLREQGTCSLGGLAASLNAEGMKTPRGGGGTHLQCETYWRAWRGRRRLSDFGATDCGGLRFRPLATSVRVSPPEKCPEDLPRLDQILHPVANDGGADARD